MEYYISNDIGVRLPYHLPANDIADAYNRLVKRLAVFKMGILNAHAIYCDQHLCGQHIYILNTQ
jgi:hypothetical protein